MSKFPKLQSKIKCRFSKRVLSNIKNGYVSGNEHSTHDYINRVRPMSRYDFNFFTFLVNLKPNKNVMIPVMYLRYITWVVDAMYDWNHFPYMRIEYERISNEYFNFGSVGVGGVDSDMRY